MAHGFQELAGRSYLSMGGQVLMFRLEWAAVLRSTGWKKFDPEEISKVQAVLRAQIRAMMAE